MRLKRSHFKHKILPYLLIAPQLLVTLVFFIWPAGMAIKESFYRGDAFGIHSKFVWLANFIDLFHSGHYLNSVEVTVIFSLLVTISALASSLLMATLVNRVIKAQAIYKTLLIWPYAVAPAVAGIIWMFLFDPAIGIVTYGLAKFGYQWNYTLHPGQAMFLVVAASAWQQFSYNFVFFLAGLQAIPKSLLEAAAMDGATPFKRFWTIIFPSLSPTTFFLIVMNLIYAFFNTFGVIQVITNGGPAGATDTLVFRVYTDGFVGLNIGMSAAESVILMLIVVGLIFIQFRYIEHKVHY